MKVLVAEDEPISRRLLERHLQSYGFEVISAKDGLEAWEIFQKEKENIYMVIIDWIMPRMNGVELCRRIRSSKCKHYTYLIFLSGKGEKKDIITALEAGADDYITKPFDPAELKVRIFAGKRIIDLENRLNENNEKLRIAYEMIRKDLETAAEVQKKLLPTEFPSIKEIEFAARFIPSKFVSGDIYNIFRLDEHHVGLYQIDVSGHGVTAAFFSVSLYRRLTQDLQSKGLLKIPLSAPPYYRINPPENVIKTLDEECADMLIKQGHYFTMIYAVLDTKTWELSFCRAGHNPLLVISNSGDAFYITDGSTPIGLHLPREDKSTTVKISPGDRIIIFSDGLNEASSMKNELYGMDRVKDFLQSHRSLPLSESFDLLLKDIRDFQGKEEFSDDVSILGLSRIR